MNSTAWADFIALHAQGDRNADIARKIGVDSSNITRWRKDNKAPEPQAAVAFAKAYGASPIAALIAAGYLTRADMELHLAAPDLSRISTQQLLDELQRRLAELQSSFDLLERDADRTALETLVTALTSRHLPANVGGNEQTASIRSIDEHRASRLEIDYDPDNAQLVEESLADRYAALEADDPEHEQIAPDTP